MKRRLLGSMTVEAAYVIPLILVVFGVALTLLFYYHDKVLLLSAVQETANYAGNREEKSEQKIREHFESLVYGRTLLLGEISVDIDVGDEGTIVSCMAKTGILSLEVEGHMVSTKPEDCIRLFRKLQKIEEEVKEHHEDLHEK